MRFLTLLIFFCFSGCFAAYLSDSDRFNLPRKQQLTTPALIISAPDAPETTVAHRSASERFLGKGALGHQYLLIFPVTRLYLEEGPTEFIREVILSTTPHGVVSNTNAADYLPKGSRSISLTSEELSLSVLDFFLLRRMQLSGQLLLSDGRALPLKGSRLSHTGTTEELSELLKNALLEILPSLSTPPPPRLKNRTPLRLCPPPELSAKEHALQIGMEWALRRRHQPFISFRSTCPSSLSGDVFELNIRSAELTELPSERAIHLQTEIIENSQAGRTSLGSRELSVVVAKERGTINELDATLRELGERVIAELLD